MYLEGKVIFVICERNSLVEESAAPGIRTPDMWIPLTPRLNQTEWLCSGQVQNGGVSPDPAIWK